MPGMAEREVSAILLVEAHRAGGKPVANPCAESESPSEQLGRPAVPGAAKVMLLTSLSNAQISRSEVQNGHHRFSLASAKPMPDTASCTPINGVQGMLLKRETDKHIASQNSTTAPISPPFR